MNRLRQKRLQLQLLFALVAAISVAVLTVDLVLNAVQHAEGYVLSDTHRNLDHAIQELQREYQLRINADSNWSSLPVAARDLTLRAISQTVLGAYPGIEGGFWTDSQFLGYSYPTHDGGSPKVDVPAAERPSIQAVIEQARNKGSASKILRGRHDLLMISAFSSGSAAVWAMKRLPGQAESGQRNRNLLLAALVGVAFLGAAGVLATGIGLHRGVSQIKQGLAALNQNFVPGLPERPDELGDISAAINEMARVRRRLEAEVRREDRLRATGRLVGRIAHEMRNPLNSIRLSLQMLAHRYTAGKLKYGDFQLVIDEVDRMNRLLSDLLAFQQPRPPRTESRALPPILQDCARLVNPQAEQRQVDIVVATGAPSAVLDEQYTRQVMTNLLLNAIEVSGAGGRVDVQARSVGLTTEIEVTDRGPGLTSEQQEHLFEPFFTTKPDGHGLGLAVSRELAQSMGGDLIYQPGSSGGATFILRLRGVVHEA